MKKIIIIISFVLIANLAFGQSDGDSCEKFSIKVRIWTFMGDAYFTVTDSLVWVSRDTEFSSEYYDKKLNCFFTQRLRNFLKNTNLDSSKSTYVNHNVDDANNYDFTIIYNGKVITKEIYMERFNEYIELTKLMNNLVPEYFHLGYDEDYLHGKFKARN